MQRRLASVLVALALAGATLVAYAELRHNDFVSYDDNKYTYENPHVLRGLDAESVRWAFTTFHDANWFPLTWLSLMADRELFGPGPGGTHLVNLLLHLASTLLLFGALRRMTGALWRSAFVAGIFALHPLHVESVAWAAERKDVLSGLFWMLGLLAWARYAERPSALRYAAVFVAMALGLASKATLVTFPFVLLLLDAWPLRRLGWPPARGVLLEKLPLLGLSALSSAITFVAQQQGGAVQAHVPLLGRLANAVVSYAAYLEKAVWPAGLAFFYPYRGAALTPLDVAGAALLLSALTAVAVASARRVPAVLVGWLWYLGTLVPMIGVVQVGYQAMADRYTYVPLVGVAISVAWGVGALVESRPAARRLAGGAGAAALAACAVLCFRQVGVWRSNETLFGHALAVTRDNYMAHYSLGYELLQQGRYEQAVSHLRSALRLQPAWDDARSNLGVALLGAGEAEEAAVMLGLAAQAQPGDLRVRLYLARAHRERGALDAARRTLEEIVRLEPRLATAHLQLAEVQLELGRVDRALRAFAAVDALTPAWPEEPSAAALGARLVERADAQAGLDARSAALADRIAARLGG